MDQIEEIVESLRSLMVEQSLQERALSACRESLRSCAREERELGLQELGGWPH